MFGVTREKDSVELGEWRFPISDCGMRSEKQRRMVISDFRFPISDCGSRLLLGGFADGGEYGDQIAGAEVAKQRKNYWHPHVPSRTLCVRGLEICSDYLDSGTDVRGSGYLRRHIAA